MTTQIEVEVVDTGLQAKIRALLKAGQSRKMFSTIGTTVANRVRLCFKLGIDPWGSPWAALKLRKGQPLVDTGLLRRSITAKANNSGVTIGTNRRHARVHQFGATIVPKPENKSGLLVFRGGDGKPIFARQVEVPQRAFLPKRRPGVPVVLPPLWSTAVARALRRYFVKSVEKV